MTRTRAVTKPLASSRTLPVLARLLRAEGVAFEERFGLAGLDLEELSPAGDTCPPQWGLLGKRTCCKMTALLDANLQVIVCDGRRKTAAPPKDNFELSD